MLLAGEIFRTFVPSITYYFFMKRLSILIVAALILSACGERRHSSFTGEEIYVPVHAKGFGLYRSGEHSSILEVYNPWQGASEVTTRLFISHEGEKAPEGFSGQSVGVRPASVVCLSSSYIAFIDALGEIDAVKGVSGARYITNPVIHERHESGSVRDIGYDTNMNYEVLASLRPDIVFIYGVGGENTSVTNKLRELGLTVIYIADYLEEDPLGKAEWIVFFGEIFGKREKAEEIFSGICERYDALRDTAAGFSHRPVVMLNAPYRDVWFVPGDRSYMVRLISDAGGIYACAGEDSSVSRPISGESAWMAANGADVWMNPNQATTLAELKAENPKFSNIPAVVNGQVFNCTKHRTAGGGSDFWESGALRADIALEDIMHCLHPRWNGGRGDTYYFERLE